MNKKALSDVVIVLIFGIIVVGAMAVVWYLVHEVFNYQEIKITKEECIKLENIARQECYDKGICPDLASCMSDCDYWAMHYIKTFKDDPDTFNWSSCLENCNKILCEQVEVDEIEYVSETICAGCTENPENCMNKCLDNANHCLHEHSIYEDTTECETYLTNCQDDCKDSLCNFDCKNYTSTISKSEITTDWLEINCKYISDDCQEFSEKDKSGFYRCVDKHYNTKYNCFDSYIVEVSK